MELGAYLPYLVNRVGQRFISDMTPVLNKVGVDIQSWRVLIALYQRGGQPVGALSDLTSINFSTLSRVLDRRVLKHGAFARSDAPSEAAREGVGRILSEFQRQRQMADLRAFGREAAREGTDESYARFLQRGKNVRESAKAEDSAD